MSNTNNNYVVVVDYTLDTFQVHENFAISLLIVLQNLHAIVGYSKLKFITRISQKAHGSANAHKATCLM